MADEPRVWSDMATVPTWTVEFRGTVTTFDSSHEAAKWVQSLKAIMPRTEPVRCPVRCRQPVCPHTIRYYGPAPTAEGER